MTISLDEILLGAQASKAAPAAEVVNIDTHRKRPTKQAKARFAMSFDWPEQDNRGPRPKSVANFAKWCAGNCIRFRSNVFANVVEMQTRDRDWSPLDDASDTQQWLALTAAGCDMPREFWNACIVAETARNPHDPPLLYVNGLNWDGECRLDTWLIRHAGAPDTSYIRAVGRLVFVALVRRIRAPGTKFDSILILEGGQGIGKSRLVQAIVPDATWFTDALEIGADSKATIEQTAGKVIVELAELAGLGSREVERVKSFASRQSDRARMSYGRHAVERPRRFICIATTNPDASATYLTDTTGNRRFLPIPVTRHVDVAALIAERDALWSEAAALEAEGEPIHLSAEIEQEAREVQAARLIEDPWRTVLAATTDGRIYVTVKDVWDAVAPDVSKQNAHIGRRIANVMAALGYQKTVKRTGKNSWETRYRLKDAEADHD